MSLSILKTGAIAVTVLALSVTGAFAATYGTLDYDTKVKAQPKHGSQTVNYADEGDYVRILDYSKKNGGWFKIKLPGPDGWVKRSAIDIDMDDYKPNKPNKPNKPGVEFCFTGPLGYVCVNQ